MHTSLERRVGLAGATALNIIEMVGVGPFITIPLIVHAMGGPQAMLGWLFGAVFALSDGMVWAELGAMFPRAGGSYEYLKEAYGPRWGRALAFMYVWQTSFSAPMSIASGCVGFAQYGSFIFPALTKVFFARSWQLHLPAIGIFRMEWSFGATSVLAMSICALAIVVCYRGIANVAAIAKLLVIGVLGTALWVLVAGALHFNRNLAFDFPPNAFSGSTAFFQGLGAATLIAIYDFWGYYNVNFFGGEVLRPERNVPRAIVISIFVVGSLYLSMNLCILGVVPWRSLDSSRNFTVSLMMQSIYGTLAGRVAAALVMWTAFASVVSVLTGITRVGYAAARDGNYFRSLAHLHPARRFPDTSLLALGSVAVIFCTLRLQDLITALVVMRILLQFLAQAIGLLKIRSGTRSGPRPFRMPLYPLPVIMAILGYIFVLISRPNAGREIVLCVVIALLGAAIYAVMVKRRAATASSSHCL